MTGQNQKTEARLRRLGKNGWPTGMCLAIHPYTRRACTKPRDHRGEHHHDPDTWRRRT